MVPHVGKSDKSRRLSSRGRFESNWFWNCGQLPPEMTATFTMPRRAVSSVDISASRDDLLSASVPSRSKTISFFMRVGSSFREVGSCQSEKPGARRHGCQTPGTVPLQQLTKHRGDSERPSQQRAALPDMVPAGNPSGCVQPRHATREQGVQDAGTGERIDESQGVPGGVNTLVVPRVGNWPKRERAGHQPPHPAAEGTQALGERREGGHVLIHVEAVPAECGFGRDPADVGPPILDRADTDITACSKEQLNGIVRRTFEMSFETEETIMR